MARIEDLIDEIADSKLRAQIAREVKHLKTHKRFGLVYEEHVPETVALFGLQVRPGDVVLVRTEPDDPTRWEVKSVEGDKAEIGPIGDGEVVGVVPTRDLLVEKQFEEPIFPGLTSVGTVERGGDKPFHSVIQAENFHALQLLVYTHAGKVDVIYIDPPYNTGDKSWKYNNRFVDGNDAYRHSKWLAMMEKRLRLARTLLKLDGVLIVTIDEHEVHHLGMLLEELFPDRVRQLVTIVMNPSGSSRDGLSRVEEYALFVAPEGWTPSLTHDDLLTSPTGSAKQPAWESLLRRGSTWYRAMRPNLCYPVLLDRDTLSIVGAGQPHPDVEEDNVPTEVDGHAAAWPVRSDGRLGIWRVDGNRLMELAAKGYAYVSRADERRGTWTIKYLMSGTIQAIEDGEVEVVGRGEKGEVILSADSRPTKTAKTVWFRGSHTAGGAGGTQSLTSFLGTRGRFDFPKSVYAVFDALQVASAKQDAVVLDFFAGSGTTLHSVAMLNAQDGGRRQCILVTNNDVSDPEAKALNRQGHFVGDPEYEAQGIFDAVTKPRVESAITGVRPDGEPVEGKYLDQYLPDHAYADGFDQNVAFFRMDYLEPDLVELGRQYEAIAPLLWMAAGSVGSWEPWSGKVPWSAPVDSSYAVLFDEAEAAAFGAYVESRSEEITHVWIVTDSHSAFLDLQEELPGHVVVGQLYRDYLRNFVINAPGVLG